MDKETKNERQRRYRERNKEKLKTYYKAYRERKKKERDTVICKSCGEPILNSKNSRAKVHPSSIKGVLSACQKDMQRKYKKTRYLRKPDKNPIPWKRRNEPETEIEKVKRDCMCCGKQFDSIGKFNRLCMPCKASNCTVRNHAKVLGTNYAFRPGYDYKLYY